VKSTRRHVAVFVTVPDRAIGREIARAALESRNCACAQILSGLESHYWWQGRLEIGREWLVLFKTTRSRLAALEKSVLALHPYDTPEFVVLPLVGGSARYLAWLDEETRPRRIQGPHKAR
jgi:periplasmic divalent cation tolerance protein